MKQAGRCWVDVCHCYIDVRTDPWGLQPSAPLKAINPWPAVPCTVPSIAPLQTHFRLTHTFSSLYMHKRRRQGNFVAFCSTLQVGESGTYFLKS